MDDPSPIPGVGRRDPCPRALAGHPTGVLLGGAPGYLITLNLMRPENPQYSIIKYIENSIPYGEQSMEYAVCSIQYIVYSI